MNDHQKKFSRRDVIKIGLLGTTAPFLISISGQILAATSGSKALKSEAQYRDEPNGKEQCSNCIQFLPGKSPNDNGECKVVAGKISAQGWCNTYAPKP